MKFNKLIVSILFLGITLSLSAYNAVGHRIIADIAYNNLTKKTRKQVDKILGKHGIIYSSTWADEVKSDKKYSYSYQWHYQNLKDNMSEDDIKMLLTNPKAEGDHLFYAIDSLTVLLKKDKKNVEALKFLIHFIGDLHQPMHLGRASDLGGNKVETKWFGKTINIHSLWDTYLIEFNNFSYSEYSTYLQDKYKLQNKDFKEFSILQSVEAGYEVRNLIYNYDTKDTNNYHYMYFFSDKVDEMLYRGGIQLANVLNKIYN